MSDHNVQLVRKVLEAFNLRDVETVVEAAHVKIAFFAPTAVVTERRYDLYRGHDGIRAYFDDVASVWEELLIQPDEYRYDGDGVVALGTVRGRLKGGQQPIESGVAWAWRVRDGKLVWGRVYTNPDDALGDLGIQ